MTTGRTISGCSMMKDTKLEEFGVDIEEGEEAFSIECKDADMLDKLVNALGKDFIFDAIKEKTTNLLGQRINDVYDGFIAGSIDETEARQRSKVEMLTYTSAKDMKEGFVTHFQSLLYIMDFIQNCDKGLEKDFDGGLYV